MQTRRQFVIGSVAMAGGFAVGCRVGLPGRAGRGRQSWLTPYVLVDREGITIIAPRAEMGQGIHTTLAALVAEELDVRFDDIRVAHGPASELYSNEVFYGPQPEEGESRSIPTQATGGQTSIRDAFVKMRRAGAAARGMLVQAAAGRLGVDPGSLATREGAVVDADGNGISYVDLAEAAAGLEPPPDPPLKPRAEWELLGRSLPRVDMLAKCDGTARFGIDVRLPAMLYGTVKRNPRLGAGMVGFDASEASAMRGVVKIVPLETGVVIIATNTWYAFQAAERIAFDWGPAPYPATTAAHGEEIDAAFERRPYYRARDRGDVDAALAGAPVIEGAYRVPYLAHATMEPLSATARLADGELDIWCGNQFPTLAQLVGARLTGLPREAVRVHTTYMGGGFGRRFEMDDVEAAVRAAQAMPGTPVQVTYTRQEDFTHDAYRPMAAARFRAAVKGGQPAALDLHLSAPSLFLSGSERQRRLTGEPPRELPRTDVSIAMGANDQPYRIDDYRVTAYRPPDLLPVGWWRSVGESQNCFFHESILDEMAAAAGADPLEMRLSLLEHRPSRRALEAVAEMSGWGSPLPEGHARGVAYILSSGVPTALVLEIRRSEAGIELRKAWVAVDVGIALDHRNIEAQVEGGLLFGLSSAICGEITVTDGAVDQANFHEYPLLRMHQAPEVEVRIHENVRGIRGVGEVSTPVAAPALGNAIFAATGRRIRELPFGRQLRFV